LLPRWVNPFGGYGFGVVTLEYTHLLVRYGEIGLKRRYARKRFEQTLLRNIRWAVRNREVKLVRRGNRILLETCSIRETTVDLLKVFGVVSVSPAILVPLKKMDSAVLEYASSLLEDTNSFALRVRRVGSHTFTSRDVAQHLGARILAQHPNLKVDLTKPEKTINIEIRGDDVILFSEVFRGEGGLPVGTQGCVIVFFDAQPTSLVAAWLMLKRGCDIAPVTTPGDAELVENYLKALEPWVPHKLCCETIPNMFSPGLARIAKERGARCLVTSETLGDPPSESLEKFKRSDQVAPLPVLRPLIGYDKEEVEALSRKILGQSTKTVVHPKWGGQA